MKLFSLIMGLPAVLAGLGAPAQAALVHRWSFNGPAGPAPAGTTIPDGTGTAAAVVIGVGAVLDSTTLTLPGSPATSAVGADTIAAYVDLPNGLISSKTNLTVEIWASLVSLKSNQRLADFGRMSHGGVGAGAAPGEVTNLSTAVPVGSISDDLNWNLSRSGSLSAQRLESRLNGTGAVTADTNLTTTAGTEYHFVMTYTAGAGTFPAGGQARWYRDGTLAGTINLAYRLSSIEDVNNWLGRSQNPADATANIRYNEVRLWDHAFSQTQVDQSRAAGPNTTFQPPAAVADSFTLNLNRKARVAVLANDSGALAGTVTIVTPPASGTAVADAEGRVLYTHTTGTPATDSFSYRVTTLGGTSAPARVTLTFSPDLRLTNPSLLVPLTPPATEVQLNNAFPGVAPAAPTTLATAPGDTRRLFITEKAGVVRLIPDVTATTPTSLVFLNLATVLTTRNLPAFLNEAISTSSEQGLLGLAFHPDYANNGYFYVFYSVDKDNTAASPIFERVSRFTRSTANPALADPNSELVLIEQPDDYTNHQGGCLQFGPDGYLYISLGDEGDQNDLGDNSQRIDKDFFSGILRIDVDRRAGNLEPPPHPNPAYYAANPPPDAVMRDAGVARYRVPVDNPWVRSADGGTWNGQFNGATLSSAYVRTEFWAVGLRNPWRMSFDRDPADQNRANLWVGDVGGGQREEINVVTVGKNYGWAFREGMVNGPKSGLSVANFDTLHGTRPLYEYRRNGTSGVDASLTGNSVTGGVVYRGSRFPSFEGAYFFADYVSGNVWTLRRNGSSAPTVTRIASEGGITGFGLDPSNGDVLIADFDNNLIRRVTTGLPAASTFPATLAATNLFADLTDLSPAPGLIPYEVNLPFWSDYALKRRWLTLPAGNSRMTWSRDGLWTFPTGQIWVKHFDMELTRGDPATRKRLETRLLVRNAGGSYGVSYRWNDAGTDATLVPDEGAEFPLTVSVAGTPVTTTWQIPGRGQCLICHTPQAGHALSSNTRQFNLASIIPGYSGNQLAVLGAHNFFTTPPESPNLLPRHLRPEETAWPPEARVRSYLDVNCAYCHRSGGSAPTTWDMRSSLPLAATGLIRGAAANNGGNPLNQLIVPGLPERSIVLNRMAAANGFTRMPPLGTTQTDPSGISLLTEWIGTALPARADYASWRQEKFGSTVSAQGAPDFDADGDGHSNQAEFLLGTAPRDSTSLHQPVAAAGSGGNFQLQFDLPANRSAVAETSADLFSWQLWDVPGNHGLPRPAGPLLLQGPMAGPRRYFRLQVRED